MRQAENMHRPTHRIVGTRQAGDTVVILYRSWHDERYVGVRNQNGERFLIRRDLLLDIEL